MKNFSEGPAPLDPEAEEFKTEAGELRDQIEGLKSRIFRIKEVLKVNGRNLTEGELSGINNELEELGKELDFLLKDQEDLHRGIIN